MKVKNAGDKILNLKTVALLKRQNINKLIDLILYLKKNSINSFLKFDSWDIKTLRNLEAFLFVEQIEYYYN